MVFLYSLVLFQVAATDNNPFSRTVLSTTFCLDVIDAVTLAVDNGHLTKARHLAQYNTPVECQSQVSSHYETLTDRLFQMQDNFFLNLIQNALEIENRPLSHDSQTDVESCNKWNTTSFSIEVWDSCCSSLLEYLPDKEKCFDDYGRTFCCHFDEDSASYLRLPALRELRVAMNLSLESGKVSLLNLQQDGFLRLFDTSIVLWPAGYLLSLCVAAPNKCGIPELGTALEGHSFQGPIGIELGAGIGVPSISFALSVLDGLGNATKQRDRQPLVVATDKMPQALALVLSNAYYNLPQPHLIDVSLVDHSNPRSLQNLTQAYFKDGEGDGFSIVLGSSLLGFFDDTNATDASLWTALDILLSRSNKEAMAIFAHTTELPIKLPQSEPKFSLLRRISGDVFQMKTRSSSTSDFQISIFQRSQWNETNVLEEL